MLMDTIKPELARVIQAIWKAGFVMTPITMRESSVITAKQQELPKVDMAAVVDTVLTDCGAYDVPVRIYIPEKGKSLPVLIYYHGGGFVIDTVAVYDPVCRRIAKATGHIVVSPEYRLAPENPYPAAEIDALAVAKRTLPGLTALSIPHCDDLTVCGDSAGGYLAAVVSSVLQGQADIPLTHQVLIYPCLDLTHSFPSIKENCRPETGFTKEKLYWYFQQYYGDHADRRAASPLWQQITEHMPDTLVITAQFCPFRDEAWDYVRRLRAVGVRAEKRHYTSMVHSYLNFEKICYSEICDTYEQIADFLRQS